MFVFILVYSKPLISDIFKEVEVEKTDLQDIIKRYRDEHSFAYLLWMWVAIACWLVLFTIVDFVKLVKKLLK
jgi:hypothetical protein